MGSITFYSLPTCPFCAKVRATLEDLDLEYETVEVPRSRTDRIEVERVSGQRGVPVISDPKNDVEGMAESDVIVTYLRETYGDD